MVASKAFEIVFHHKVADELKSVTQRTPHQEFHKPRSIRGRCVCVLLLPVYTAGIVVKPMIYTAMTVVSLAAVFMHMFERMAVSLRRGSLDFLCSGFFLNWRVIKMLNFAGCAAVSPFVQVAHLARALAGIIRPDAYFTKPPAPKPLVPPTPPAPPAPPVASPISTSVHNNTCFIDCDRTAPEERPAETLQALAQVLLSRGNIREIRVKFNGESGIDAGGLRRDFMYRLFQSLVSKQVINLQQPVPAWEPEKDQLYKDIGAVLGLLIADFSSGGDVGSLPIGDVFHSQYFAGVAQFSAEEAQAPFESLSAERLLAVLANSTFRSSEKATAFSGYKDEMSRLGDQLYFYEQLLKFHNWANANSRSGPADTIEDDCEAALIQALQIGNPVDLPDDAYTAQGTLSKAKIGEVRAAILAAKAILVNNADYAATSLPAVIGRIEQWRPSEVPAGALPDEFAELLQAAEDYYAFEPKPEHADRTNAEQVKALCGELVKFTVEEFGGKKNVKTMHAIAKGISTDGARWDRIRAAGQARFKLHVQGSAFDKALLIKRIDFGRIKPEQETAVREWIASKEEKDLRRFLFFVTSAGVIPLDRKIEMRPVWDGGRFVAHTCFNYLDIPSSMTPEKVKEMLDNGINSEMNYDYS